ncbi:S1 family peptidase [Streptomyces sp. NPDC019531]|uniref:S1 family peptidase n=1 Tax=Streptomyces sp. NPDC019531 TaxID=3365062 RepID=UPI003850000E
MTRRSTLDDCGTWTSQAVTIGGICETGPFCSTFRIAEGGTGCRCNHLALGLSAAGEIPAQAIVGGTPVPGGWFGDPAPTPNPYGFVGRLTADNGMGCTASLVAPDLALTAGHCSGPGTITFGMLNKDRDHGETRRIVEERLQDDADLTLGLGSTLLVRLDSPILDIPPVALGSNSSKNLWSTGKTAKVLGWGQINDTARGTGTWSAELREATLRVQDTAISLPPLRGMMKLSNVTGHPAHGDSGGPILASDSTGRLVQFGIFEGTFKTGGYYANRIWPQKKLLEYVNAHQGGASGLSGR